MSTLSTDVVFRVPFRFVDSKQVDTDLFHLLLQLPEAMEPTVKAVEAVGADLGIVLDTDVDRSGVVDKNGDAINRNRLIALMATVVLRDSPGTTIVTDSTTSNGLKVRPPEVTLFLQMYLFPQMYSVFVSSDVLDYFGII